MIANLLEIQPLSNDSYLLLPAATSLHHSETFEKPESAQSKNATREPLLGASRDMSFRPGVEATRAQTLTLLQLYMG